MKSPVAGMHVLNSSQLANYTNQNAKSSMNALQGYFHENAADAYPEGSRAHEFHSARSAQHFQASDKAYRDAQKYVSIRKEKISSKTGSKWSGES